MVTEMSQRTGNPALQRYRIGTLHQHLPVMITLEQQRTAVGEHLNDMWCNRTSVGQHSDTRLCCFKNKLDRLVSVVRNRISGHSHSTDCDRHLMSVNNTHIRYLSQPLTAQRAMREPHRQPESAREHSDPANMVLVLVGNQYAVETLRSDTQHGESLFQLPCSKTTIEQQPGGATLDQRGISAAATSQ